MPRAGFYPIESHVIRFGRDGEWYGDGERIANPRIAKLFSRSVVREPDGSFALRMGEERAPIEVEDTPFVVVGVEGDPERGFRVQLNDDSEEPLAAETLRHGADHALYCRVKGGELEARFMRPAYYELARWIEPGDGGFRLPVAGRRFAIGTRA